MEITTVLLLIAIIAIFVGASVLKSKQTDVIVLPPSVNTNISQITEDVYISDRITASDYESLKRLGIKQILIVGSEIPRHGDLYFKVFHVKINDLPTENIKKYFNPSFNFIKKNKTLIHCAMGVSRSVSIAIAYLMRSMGIFLISSIGIPFDQVFSGFAKSCGNHGETAMPAAAAKPRASICPRM